MKESQIQIAFFQWISHYPRLRKSCWATPNGGTRNAREAVNLKRQGVTPGVPDIMLAIPSHPYHGLFIEFKSENGKLTDSQSKFIDRLTKDGYKCSICRCWTEARKAIQDYFPIPLLEV